MSEKILSDVVMRTMYDNLARVLDKDFIAGLNESTYLDFEAYRDRLNDRYSYYDNSSSVWDEAVSELVLQYENYYDYMNSLTFICDLDRIGVSSDRLDKSRLERLFRQLQDSDYEGIVLNCRGCDYVVRLNKFTYTVRQVRTNIVYNPYGLTITSVKGGEVDSMSSVNLIVIPELYPRLFSLRHNIGHFEQLNLMPVVFEDTSTDINESELVIVPYGIRCKDSFIAYPVDKLLDAVLFCIDRFFNRKRIYRKGKEKEVSGDVRVNVSTGVINSGEHKYTALSDVVIYERGTGKVCHGHHASPREHERRGHWRHYKNGKKVYVNSTIVAKGSRGGKVVYKV